MKRIASTLAVSLLLVTAGCTGIVSDVGEDTPTRAQESELTSTTTPTATSTTATRNSTVTSSSQWNASVDIQQHESSFATSDYVINGWDVTIQITSLENADEVVYVYEAVNVVEGNSTRPGTVGDTVGESIDDSVADGRLHPLSLLQANDTVTVYAVRGDERKQIGFIEITSSYTASWDGERGHDDSWRGEPPEDFEE